jgi:7,8-dihydropterin-6-yl-methyl-4-(beta-D-ribofuranosyl)aminobenzene 5'-phosphate synthase
MEAAGAEVGSTVGHTVCGDFFYVSGMIPRQTSYETGLPGHMSKRAGTWEVDEDINDERYLAVKIRGQGVVVFSACSHAGVVNVMKDAMRELSEGDDPLFAVMGGFHLSGGKTVQGRITETVRDMVRLKPKLVVPGHCTGWRAKVALANAFPDAYQPCVVAGTYSFTAADLVAAEKAPSTTTTSAAKPKMSRMWE